MDTAIKILGIDPGSRVTGYGVIWVQGQQLRYISSGCIRTPAQGDLAPRLQAIYQGVADLIYDHQPQEVAVEQVFFHRNARSALKLGQARGVAIAGATVQGAIVAEYSPRRVKQAVVGYGAADKAQVQQMVKRLLCLNGLPATDAADALAIAICHAHQRTLKFYTTHE